MIAENTKALGILDHFAARGFFASKALTTVSTINKISSSTKLNQKGNKGKPCNSESHNYCITESWAGWGLKGPLEII